MQNMNGIGIGVYGSSNPSIYISNPSGDKGIDVYVNSGSATVLNLGTIAKGLVVNSGLSSTGNFIELNKNGVDKLIVNQEGAVTATSFTGSLFGTSSWATYSLTSSFVTASNVFGPFGSNSIISASFAVSSSRSITSSFATTASYVLQAVSSSFATTASYASNGGVTSIVAGTNITISSATGNVTINSTGGGGGGTDLGLVQAMTVGLQNIF